MAGRALGFFKQLEEALISNPKTVGSSFCEAEQGLSRALRGYMRLLW